MATDIVQLLNDYNIPNQTEGHKHCRPGWVNVKCPFCTGNPGLHLGITLNGKTSYCWRCGWHPVEVSLLKLIPRISREQVKQLMIDYIGVTYRVTETTVKVKTLAFTHPTNTGELNPFHKRYLEKRKFDPDKLIKEWGILGTSPISILKTRNKSINYSNRILAPIYWNGDEVTFQARDITNHHPMKYLASLS